MLKPMTRSNDILEIKNHSGNKKSNTKTYATEEKLKEQKQS